MHTTAHPDDENNGVLALHARGQGMRVALLTATRGDGGQNEIGPELFDAIGVLRTEELLAAHRWDGAEQYFTRAVDFGFSFSPQETIQKWGHDEILGDFVRMIRTIRPDVIVTLPPTGTGGGQHHMVSATLTLGGVHGGGRSGEVPGAAAAGPASVAGEEALSAGRRRVRRVSAVPRAAPADAAAGRGGPPAAAGRAGRACRRDVGPGGDLPPPPPADPNAKYATVDTSGYDPLIGCTIGEVGGVAASMHKCQGRSPIQNFGGASGARYKLAATVHRLAEEQGRDVALRRGRHLAREPAAVRRRHTRRRRCATASPRSPARGIAAQKAFQGSQNPAVTLPDLLAGLTAVRALRAGLGSMGLSDLGKYEIDFRMEQKEDAVPAGDHPGARPPHGRDGRRWPGDGEPADHA